MEDGERDSRFEIVLDSGGRVVRRYAGDRESLTFMANMFSEGCHFGCMIYTQWDPCVHEVLYG